MSDVTIFKIIAWSYSQKGTVTVPVLKSMPYLAKFGPTSVSHIIIGHNSSKPINSSTKSKNCETPHLSAESLFYPYSLQFLNLIAWIFWRKRPYNFRARTSGRLSDFSKPWHVFYSTLFQTHLPLPNSAPSQSAHASHCFAF